MIWNFICKKAEQSQIQAVYGTVIEVNGRNMVADIKGEDNETTIILLPGAWVCKSRLFYRKASDSTSNFFRFRNRRSGELLAGMADTGDWQKGERISSGGSEEDVKAWVEELGLSQKSDWTRV